MKPLLFLLLIPTLALAQTKNVTVNSTTGALVSPSASTFLSANGIGSGSITSITAGQGLFGGTITGSGTLSLNPSSTNTWNGEQIFSYGLSLGGSSFLTQGGTGTATLPAGTGTLVYSTGTLSNFSGTITPSQVSPTIGTGTSAVTLDSNGNIPLFHAYSNPTPVFMPTGTVSGSLTPTLFNVIELGDSITAGVGATNQPNTYYQASAPTVPASGWAWTLATQGFCEADVSLGTSLGVPLSPVFDLGYGGETLENGTAHLYCSQGQTCSVALTNGSATGSLTAVPQFIISGAVVTGSLLPTGTVTMTNTQVVTSATLLGNTATITVPSATGLSTGMYAEILNGTTTWLANNPQITNISSNTLTMSQNCATGGFTVTGTVVFFSPTVTFSGNATGSGTVTLTSGGTQLTGTLVSTKGQSTVSITGTVTGLAPSLSWSFPMGSMGTPAGDYFTGITGAGSGTGTLAFPATQTGTFTFGASATIHDVQLPTTFAPNGINATAWTLSPNLTGIPGYALDNYGINDSAIGTSTATFATNYTAQTAALQSMGYTVTPITIAPPSGNALYGENPTLVNGYNTWMKSGPISGATVCDITPLFPSGNPNYPEWTHSPITNDGIHPSNVSHAAMGGYISDFLLRKFGGSSVVLTYPTANANLNSQWLPNNVPLTTLSNSYGSGYLYPTTNGVATVQTIYGSEIIEGAGNAPYNSILSLIGGGALGDGYLNFGVANIYGNVTNNWSVYSGHDSNLTFYDDVNGVAQLSITPGSGTTGSSAFAGSVSAASLYATTGVTANNGNLTANNGYLNSVNTASGYVELGSALGPNVTAGDNEYFLFGAVAGTNYNGNAGQLTFNNVGLNSAQNSSGLGVYGKGLAVAAFPSLDVVIGSTTDDLVHKLQVVGTGSISGNLTTSAGISNTGTLSTSGPINSSITQSAVAASGSGTVTFAMPLAGSSLKVVTFHCAAATGTATYVFPTAFTNAPTEIDGLSLATTIGTGTVVITGASTTKDGMLLGY